VELKESLGEAGIEWLDEGQALRGPALAAGCTMVLKPATATPYSALAMCELAERAGVPKGVFSCVTGGSKEIGGEMTSNPTVRKLTSTGSTEVGKLLMEQCAGTVKKLSLELGGKAPFIVFDDADIEASVKSLPLRRQGARSRPNTAMPARPASAPTASWCRTASTTLSPSASPRPPGR
jgi:aldehyde dehydrogenase family protein